MDSNNSNWLKSMQNGALGEARAKAFLMNRFWVLERSVDIDGADYLIQRRLTRQNNTLSCLGVVQVKFFENDNTPIYISKDYIVGDDGLPRQDFFLLVFTGNEDDSIIYYLDAVDIIKFDEKNKDGTFKYYLTGAKLKNGKYQIISNKQTLDRMENSLSHVEFIKNKSFIINKFPNEPIDTEAIMSVFKEPIDNWWGNIPKEFNRIKKSAVSIMNELSEMYEKIRGIAIETSPMEAMIKAERIAYYLSQSYYGKWGVENSNNLFDENLYHASKEHLEKVELLRNDKLLDTFIALKTHFKKEIFSFLSESLPIDPNIIHTVTVEFDLVTLQIVNLNQAYCNVADYFNIPGDLNRFGYIEVPEYDGVKTITKNKFEYFWLAGRSYIKNHKSNKLEDFYSDLDLPIFWKCMDKMFEMKYYVR